jgi:nicotinamide mononucleotide transporter
MSVWLAQNYVELLGALLSIVYLMLSIRQNIFLWPVGILSAALYIIVFYQTKFYADMALNGYYFVISIYGWILWSKVSRQDQQGMPVVRTGMVRGLVLFTIILALFLVMGYLLDHFTDSPVPYWDAFTTAGSIVATWMLAKKIIEHWILWVIIDLVSLGLYIHRGLYPTAVLFAVYTTMAIVGYVQWKKTLKG